jgi:hypothetical protein
MLESSQTLYQSEKQKTLVSNETLTGDCCWWYFQLNYELFSFKIGESWILFWNAEEDL